jgi:DNA invertase Pin-like site-specific DNA recombinase
MNNKLRAAIYCRLSEEDKNKHNDNDDSNSIQNQKTMLLQYAISQNWDIYGIYSDDDYAGADRRRPQFNKLLNDAQDRKFDIVLCKTQSRFTRELELVEKYIHGLFPLWNIRFVSIVDNADTANKGNKKSRQINGLVNEWYLEDMSDNIRSVLTSRRQNGYHIGSFALYGYQKDPDIKGHLIVDEDAAAVVQEVFTLFSQGYGKTAIARILNERSIPNPTEYKRLKGFRYQHPKNSNSTLWRYDTISNMLTNEIYIGNMVQGKYGSVSYKTKECRPRPKDQWYIVEGTHEPIIDRELWDQVQAIICEKAKPYITGQIGVFAKKVRCGYCGYSLRSTKNRGKHYLQCQTRHVSRDACVGAFMPVAELEQMVITELKRLSTLYLNKSTLEKNIHFATNLHNRQSDLLKNIATYKKRIDECSRGIRELYMDKVKGILNETDFVELSAAFMSERDHISNLTASSQQELQALNQRLQNIDDRWGIIEQYTNVDHLSRPMVEVFINHIVIYRRDPETKQVPIQIYWDF